MVFTKNKNIIEYTMGIGRVNLLSLLFIVPVLAIYLAPYTLIWGYDSVDIGRDQFHSLFLLVLLGGIVVHELLHGATWALFTKKGFRSIRFGFQPKFLTPYCHCKEPLMVKHYLLGGAMPLVIMGIIPAIIGIAIGNGFVLSFGIFFTWAAGGDIISLFMLRSFSKDDYVFDHPEKLGFYREFNDD